MNYGNKIFVYECICKIYFTARLLMDLMFKAELKGFVSFFMQEIEICNETSLTLFKNIL